MNFYYLTGGNLEDIGECIKMAMDDHVRMLQEESKMMVKSKTEQDPVPIEGDDPF